MTQDSKKTLIGTRNAKPKQEHDIVPCKGVEPYTEASWCYLYLRIEKLNSVSKLLKRKFPIYTYKDIAEECSDGHRTIPIMLFVQGDVEAVQQVLNESRYKGIRLADDCTTSKPAVIPNATMQAFMRIAQVGTERIRILHHPIEYYAEGNTRIRLISGILAGFEGYRIRISKDRCLVTSIGGFTFAIGGIHHEIFDNVDYFTDRKELLTR